MIAPRVSARRCSALVIFAVAMVLAVPAVAGALQPGTSIYGIVTNASTGDPIQGAAVSAYCADTDTTVLTSTDALGRYELSAPLGVYDVSCYVSDRYEYRVFYGLSTDPLNPVAQNFSLTPYSKAFFGKVTDADTHVAIAGASIVVEGTSVSFNTLVKANAQGDYEIYAPPGTYSLRFTAAGYQPHSVGSKTFAAAAVEVNDALTPLVACVYGTVADGSGAVAGALVTLSWTVPDPQPDDPGNVEVHEIQTATDSEGDYRFTEPAGVYEVRATAYGYVPSAAQQATFDGTHPVRRDFVLSPKVKAIVGTVLEAGTESALSATIYITGTVDGQPFEDSTATNGQGEYALYVEPGTYNLQVSSPSHITQQVELQYAGTAVTRDFHLVPSGADSTKPETSISGIPGGWSNTDVIFTLHASDVGGSGLAGTYYQLGDGDVIEYVSSVAISAEGETTVGYWSVDGDANVESKKTAVVRIDKTPPTTTANVNPGYAGSAQITLAASDSGGSAVKSTRWRLDGGAWTSGTAVTTAVAGAHTVEFYSDDNAGNLEPATTKAFSVTSVAPTSLTMSASPVLPKVYGQSVMLAGHLRQASGAGVPSQYVNVQAYSTGTGVWTTVGGGFTLADGTITWSVKPTSATTYRLRFEGASDLAVSESATVRIVPKAYLSKAATARYGSRAYKITGTLKPRHKSGTYPVRIYRWKKSGGKWVAKGYSKAKVADYQGYSRYTVRYTFPSKGSWRLRAVAPADSLHQSSNSAYTYFTVK